MDDARRGSGRRLFQAHRTVLALGILLAGLVAGLAIYATAPPADGDVLGNQASESKRYLREMETYGGTANVVATEIRDWFAGLWQGRRLGVTIACLCAALAAVVFLVLMPLPPSRT